MGLQRTSISMDKQFLHWLGGFFDGEGSTGFYNFKKFRQLKVTLRQKDKDILEYVRRKVGYGSVCTDYKCKGIYGWYCSSARARWFLKLILPYLKTKHKRKQTIKALRLDRKYIKPAVAKR